MKKLFIFLLSLSICFTACTSEQPSTNQNFANYDELAEAFSGEESTNLNASGAQFRKGHYGEKYELFFDTMTASEGPLLPRFDNEAIALRDTYPIMIEPRGSYGLTWIWYNGFWNNEEIRVKTAYPSYNGITGITEEMDTSEILKLISPKAPNVHNYKRKKYNDYKYESVYEEDLQISGTTVSAIYFAVEDERCFWVTFFYKDMLVSVEAEKSLLTEEFWNGFDLN